MIWSLEKQRGSWCAIDVKVEVEMENVNQILQLSLSPLLLYVSPARCISLTSRRPAPNESGVSRSRIHKPNRSETSNPLLLSSLPQIFRLAFNSHLSTVREVLWRACEFRRQKGWCTYREMDVEQRFGEQRMNYRQQGEAKTELSRWEMLEVRETRMQFRSRRGFSTLRVRRGMKTT